MNCVLFAKMDYVLVEKKKTKRYNTLENRKNTWKVWEFC